jgi:hypothetical protein
MLDHVFLYLVAGFAAAPQLKQEFLESNDIDWLVGRGIVVLEDIRQCIGGSIDLHSTEAHDC